MRSISKTKSNWIHWLIRNPTHLVYHCFRFNFFFICLHVISGRCSDIGHHVFLIIYAWLLIIGALIVLIELIVEIVHLNSNSRRLCWWIHFLAVVENGGVVVSYRIGLLSGVEVFESLGISVLTWLALDAVR